MKITRHEQLETLLNSLTGDNTIYGVWGVEFRGRGGWWVVSDRARHFGDNGEYLGQNWREAEKEIKFLFPQK